MMFRCLDDEVCVFNLVKFAHDVKTICLCGSSCSAPDFLKVLFWRYLFDDIK
jgi:hypothetical protein